MLAVTKKAFTGENAWQTQFLVRITTLYVVIIIIANYYFGIMPQLTYMCKHTQNDLMYSIYTLI